MKQLRERLRAPSGETLVETLVSTLIIGLSVFLLVSMVISSLRMDKQAREDDGQLYAELSAAEGKKYLDAKGSEASGPTGQKVLLHDPNPTTTDIELPVSVWGAKGGLTAYGKETSGGTSP